MRRGWGVVVGALLLCLGAGGAWGGEGDGLRLEEVMESARELHPSVVMAEARRAQAEGVRLAASGAFDLGLQAGAEIVPWSYYERVTSTLTLRQRIPDSALEVYGGHRLGLGAFPVYAEQDVTGEGGEVFFGVKVPLLQDRAIDGTRASMQRAELAVDLAAADVRSQRIRMVADAAHGYWAWVWAGRRLAIERDLLGIAEGRQAGLEERVRRGDLPAMETVENLRVVYQRQERVVRAERDLATAAFQLSIYLRDVEGRPVLPAPSRLPTALPAAPPWSMAQCDADVALALSTHPDLDRARQEVARAEVAQRLAENQRLPQADLSLGASKDLVAEGSLAPAEVKAGLAISLPAQRSEARGQAASARAAADEARARLRLAEELLAARIRELAASLDALERRLDLAAREVELARQLEVGERTRLDLGEGTVFLVQLREQARADAELRHVELAVERWRVWASYQAALGLGA